MTQKFDLKQVYTMDDLKKLQQAGASAEELRQAYRMMQKAIEEATKKLVSAMEDISFDKMSEALEKGADVNAKDENGNTALMGACKYGRTGVVQLLVKNGADVNIADEDGKTALMKACEQCHTDVARLLVRKGADVNVKDKYGDTALIKACKYGRTDVVRLLVRNGADVSVADERGKTALMWAYEEGIARVLIGWC